MNSVGGKKEARSHSYLTLTEGEIRGRRCNTSERGQGEENAKGDQPGHRIGSDAAGYADRNWGENPIAIKTKNTISKGTIVFKTQIRRAWE